MDARPNDSSCNGANVTGLGCTGLALDGKLVDHEIDMACVSDAALTTASGILVIGG